MGMDNSRKTLGQGPCKESGMKTTQGWNVCVKGSNSDKCGQEGRKASQRSIPHLYIECTTPIMSTTLMAE